MIFWISERLRFGAARLAGFIVRFGMARAALLVVRFGAVLLLDRFDDFAPALMARDALIGFFFAFTGITPSLGETSPSRPIGTGECMERFRAGCKSLASHVHAAALNTSRKEATVLRFVRLPASIRDI